MDDFINRRKLIEEYDRQHKGPAGGARKLMVEAPAADVVEVVRCKDCKFLIENKYCFQGLYGVTTYKIVLPNEFCSYGERKGE